MLIQSTFANERTPIQLPAEPPIAADHRGLLVIGDGFVTSHRLQEGESVLVGRSPECDLCIDAAHVSRRHLLIHAGAEVQVEDLGSANGTLIGGQRLARGASAIIEPGSVIEFGSVMLMLQMGFTATRPRRIWVHEYFEARLEEECLRAARTGRGFAVLRVRTSDKEARARALQELLLSALRACDIVASYAPGDYEILLCDASRDDAIDIGERVRSALAEQGAGVQVGAAHYPLHGRVPEALMARASSDLTCGSECEEVGGPVVIVSPAMRELHRLVARVAAGAINTLVLGETGSGKEVISERIHALSRRVEKPLLRINCAALTDSLLESELFGHERGAFTGATETKPGLFEVANGGTIFLDEIGDMSLALQAKLLRTLEDGTVRRVGGLTSHPVDVRIVAATHKDLEREVAEGRFRRDLFFRVAGVTLVVPPLRERVEEIPPLAASFARDASRRQRNGAPLGFSPEAMDWLTAHDWPGNIRELRNVVERAVLLCEGAQITPEHLPAHSLGRSLRLRQTTQRFEPPATADRRSAEVEAASPGPSDRTGAIDLKAGLKDRERQMVLDALERTGGNQTQAARLLGISRRTLVNRLEEFGLPRPRKKTGRCRPRGVPQEPERASRSAS